MERDRTGQEQPSSLRTLMDATLARFYAQETYIDEVANTPVAYGVTDAARDIVQESGIPPDTLFTMLTREGVVSPRELEGQISDACFLLGEEATWDEVFIYFNYHLISTAVMKMHPEIEEEIARRSHDWDF